MGGGIIGNFFKSGMNSILVRQKLWEEGSFQTGRVVNVKVLRKGFSQCPELKGLIESATRSVKGDSVTDQLDNQMQLIQLLTNQGND